MGNLTNYFTGAQQYGGASHAQYGQQSQFGSYTANVGSFACRRKPVSTVPRRTRKHCQLLLSLSF